MRTTLTIRDDIAVELERARRARNVSLKDLVNDALQLGLREMERPSTHKKPPAMRIFYGGRLLVASIDNIGELLAEVESEGYR